MTRYAIVKKSSWLLLIGVVSALGFAACQSKKEQPTTSQTTNTSQPAKASEHPEHPK